MDAEGVVSDDGTPSLDQRSSTWPRPRRRVGRRSVGRRSVGWCRVGRQSVGCIVRCREFGRSWCGSRTFGGCFTGGVGICVRGFGHLRIRATVVGSSGCLGCILIRDALARVQAARAVALQCLPAHERILGIGTSLIVRTWILRVEARDLGIDSRELFVGFAVGHQRSQARQSPCSSTKPVQPPPPS